MRKLLLALPMLLCGCGGLLPTPDAPIYSVEVTDQKQYDADLTICASYANGYHKALSISAIGQSAIKGAASNASSAVLSPLVPAAGAAGNATTELLNELDLLNTQQRGVFLKCMDKKSERDRSALVLEPNQ